MAVPRKKKVTPRGGNWSDLATPGDVQRFLRWLILSVTTDKMDTKKSAVLGQLGLYLLRTLEVSDLASQIADIEERLDRTQVTTEQHESNDSHTTH
jgi:hypothetical protein